MPDKISPEMEDANATLPASDDSSQAEQSTGDAQDVFDKAVRGDHSQQNANQQPAQEEQKELPTEETDEREDQPQGNEASEEEAFARFGSREFSSKEELLNYTKKVHGDNSRLVGDIKKLQSDIEDLQGKIKNAPDNPTPKQEKELSEADKQLEAAKQTLQQILPEMGFLTNEQVQEMINPIMQERVDRQAGELQVFIENEAPDFWDFEEQIRTLDGQTNPATGKAYTVEEAYRTVKFLNDPQSVVKAMADKEEAKKQEAAKKQASMGSTKSVSTPPPKPSNADSVDQMIKTKF